MLKKVVGILLALCILCLLPIQLYAQDKVALPLKPGTVVLPRGVYMEGKTVYMLVQTMNFEQLREDLIVLNNYSYNRLVIDLYSFGGSLFDAMGMISLFIKLQTEGKVVEIHARGMVASAGTLILLSGSKGHRYIDRYALLMFHELWSFKFFAMETPSSKEAEALIYRKIQDNVNSYIISRSKVTKEELESRIRNKEFWLTSDEALKYGFVDKVD